MLDRRRFLASLALLPTVAHGFGDVTLVDVAELDLGTTVSRPAAWKYLLYEVQNTTSVEVNGKVDLVKPTDPELFEHPFTVVQGSDAFELEDVEVEQLSRYLSYGGFLFLDDISGAENSGFDRSVRHLARRLFPTREMAPVPREHSLFRAFFLIDRPLGRLAKHRHLEAVTVGNLAPFVYFRNDLSGALERKQTGQFVRAAVPGGETQRREGLKLGINLMLYSLTANYKRDQAHVMALKRQGVLE